MANLFITIYLWVVTSLSTIITFIVCGLCYPFVSQRTFGYIYTQLFGTIVIYAMTIPRLWSLKITDLRDPNDQNFNKQFIVISNHVSFIDSLVIIRIPLTMKFIMAKKFLKIPIFSWLCRSAGHIPVSEKDKSTTNSAIDLAVSAMEDGSSIAIFPEGKRSKDPQKLLPFKTGAFRLSQRTGVPILPIVIKGTDKAMPIGGFCQLADIEIIIGKPFVISKEYQDVRDDPLMEKSREFIQNNI